jgi:glycosyltransferase involved in cell wall biosynthesis
MIKACVMAETIIQYNGATPIVEEAVNSVAGVRQQAESAGAVIINRLSIIIPAYNEEKTIAKILDRINEVKLLRNIEKEVIIVNDCSKDNTEAVIQNYISNTSDLTINYFKYIKHEINQGKGAAIHTGIAQATGEYLLVQDADLEYDPGEYNTLLKPIVLGSADVVYGSRFMGGNPHRILFFWHSIGNKFLTFLSNMFTNLNLTDMETGYKMFKTSMIQRIALSEKRFGFEPEVTAKIAMVPGVRIYEVGISYYGRTFAEGKKIGWRDGFKAIYCILKYSLFGTRAFVKQQVKV